MKKRLVLIALLPLLIASCTYRPTLNTDREAEIIAKSIQVNNEFVDFFNQNKDSIDAEFYQQIVDYQKTIADDLELARQLIEAYNDNPNDAVMASLKGILASVQEKLGTLAGLKAQFLEFMKEKQLEQDKKVHDLKDTRINLRSNQAGF